jgi:hypothetical protein
MKTTMTLGDIRAHRPCEPGWDKLVASCGTDDPGHTVSLIDILDSNGIDDAIWAVRCLPRRARVSLALAFAATVEHLSSAAAKCNAVTRRWLVGDATDDELAAAALAAGGAAALAAGAWAAWAAAWADAAGIPYDAENILRQWCAEQEVMR